MLIKINKIKEFLNQKNIYGYLVTKNDEHFKSPDNLKRDILRQLSGFTGSFGMAIITKKHNYLFVDGRYTTQAKEESGKKFQIKSISQLKDFINEKFKQRKKIAYDDRYFQLNFVNNFKKYKNDFINHPLSLPYFKKSDKINIFKLNSKFHGLKFEEKLKKLTKLLKLKKKEGFLISNSENICWLSNLRAKIPFNPIIKSKAVVKKNQLFIYLNKRYIKKNLKLSKNIQLLDEDKIFSDIKKLNTIYLDQNSISINFINKIKRKKIPIKPKEDPINFLKSIKNKIEIKNLRKAQIYDGIALVKLMFWLKNNVMSGKLSEIHVQNKLENIKKINKNYISPSFETISAFGPNGAIIHYNAKNVKKKTFLKKNNFYLLDSGSQYYFGTTDVTRTFVLGTVSNFHKNIYTYVLKGHIAVNNFNLTNKTRGKDLDKKARFFLKKYGKNYNHGTGHGIGYFLNVHENPPNISSNSKTKFFERQIMSNEPGYYKEKHFGVRLENMMMVKKEKNKKYFESLTLVPFDKNGLNTKLLSKNEVKWINDYHKKVFKTLNKFLGLNEKKYLKDLCSAI